ncbi:uncharacterized protein LOC131673241 isoform X2 [Phymastichus coffea]|uniref:uncharacterized protein LOC131673241 isoform X2 n=1 Tax=Phymastichus coffea TaxID=108790 RepID=UPI00273C24E0|nr:uncharacterized protein LOC131673241 isoform X2 [Phymastichus coffea]
MDPVGPWYTSYNRLAATPGVTATFQAATPTTANAEAVLHLTPATVNIQAVPSTTTPQLLIQAAGPTTVTLAGQPSAFNTGGFLSTPTVNYDVFTPFFHHSSPKQTTHYIAQPAQAIARAQVVTTPKPSSPTESDIPSLRTSFTSPQQNDAFFDNPQSNSSTSTVNWSLSHPSNSQITSPFGILPHESVAVSTSASVTSTTKANSAVAYENPFATHYASNGTTGSIADSKSKAQSPISNSSSTIKCIVTESSIPGAHTFFQGTSAFDSDALASGYTTDDAAVTTHAVQSSLHHQSCIVSTPNVARSCVPTTIYLDATAATDKQTAAQGPDASHDSSQSSPISFSIMDSRNLSYGTNGTAAGKQGANGSVQFHILGQQPGQQAPSSCRLYSTANADAEYHHPARSKSAASTDSAYSSNTSQNGPDCAVVVPRRPSPLQAHSQASPLGHVPSPATYPMYNSPMASMSSPSPLQPQHADGTTSTPYKSAPSVQQQMTPPSPLDVSVTRSPSQQNQVVYSSVITRALGANENKTLFNSTDATARFDRSQDLTQAKQQQQMCWDNDAQKFSGSDYLSADSSDLMSERPSCLETSTINLQDLDSCRGDPITIVGKSMPSLSTGTDPDSDEFEEQHCQQVAGIDPKRKSLERIPPPAHHNAAPQQSQQQQQQHHHHHHQQNGYVEFDRWNMSLPHNKIISNPPATASVVTQSLQQQQQTATDYMGGNATTVQHQSLLVTHHANPNVSYFSTFHMGPSNVAPMQQHVPAGQTPHHEMHSTVDMNAVAMVPGENCHQDSLLADDRPQVIVPDIEEELGFLQQPDIPLQINNNHPLVNPELKRSANSDPNSGFMTSYLKFLQGEKDSSPPPNRARKSSWNHRRPFMTATDSNGGNAWNRGSISLPSDKLEVPSIDYENDPRYFPLPKERKAFDSSDDGFSSDDELLSFGPKKKLNVISPPQSQQLPSKPLIAPGIKNIGPDGRPKKGRPIKPGGPTDRKRKAAAAAAAAAAAKGIVLPPADESVRKKALNLPKRESSRRKAKEKTSEKLKDNLQPADPYEEEEQGDSDNDPAWTPQAKANADDQEPRKKRGRPVIKRKRLDDFNDSITTPKRPGRKRKNPIDVNARANALKISCKIDEKLLASVSDEDIDISPFKHSTFGDFDDASGEFVVLKSDLNQEYPPLWRIDGKTLLQKYEPFPSNGRTLYKNISTYSGWAPQNRHIYQQVPVKFWQQNKMETVVEFLRDELITDDSDYIIKFMKETEKYQDNFEVYIQTLISQALDSNFLTEIFQEQDDYFLSNVKTVDEITEERKQQLLSTTNWRSNVVTALSTWPCINVLRDNMSDHKGKSCEGCNKLKIHSRVLLYGQPYNSTTLEGSPPGPEVPQEKDFLFCRLCQKKVGLFNKVAHQKYLMFLECARRVADKRLADPNKDTTIILNELLADESWLNLLFREVRNIWAEIDSIQQQAKRKAAADAGDPSPLKIPGVSNESQSNSYLNQINSNLS